MHAAGAQDALARATGRRQRTTDRRPQAVSHREHDLPEHLVAAGLVVDLEPPVLCARRGAMKPRHPDAREAAEDRKLRRQAIRDDPALATVRNDRHECVPAQLSRQPNGIDQATPGVRTS